MNIENFVVIVPDGLRKSKKGKQFLTNTYRKTILIAKKIAENNNYFILLLPANNFGGKLKEQEVAANFLRSQGFEMSKILVGISTKKGYIDTCDNFEEVINNECLNIYGEKFKVSNSIKGGKYTLVSNYLHMDRALRSLNILKFRKPKEIFCSYAKETRCLPLRLFYYKWPFVRQIYELLASFYIITIKRLISKFKKIKKSTYE